MHPMQWMICSVWVDYATPKPIYYFSYTVYIKLKEMKHLIGSDNTVSEGFLKHFKNTSWINACNATFQVVLDSFPVQTWWDFCPCLPWFKSEITYLIVEDFCPKLLISMPTKPLQLSKYPGDGPYVAVCNKTSTCLCNGPSYISSNAHPYNPRKLFKIQHNVTQILWF